MSGWGGARPGAGRPRIALTTLVAEQRFDYRKPNHRKALFEDELELRENDPRRADLLALQAAYRGAGGRMDQVSLAFWFGRLAGEPGE